MPQLFDPETYDHFLEERLYELTEEELIKNHEDYTCYNIINTMYSVAWAHDRELDVDRSDAKDICEGLAEDYENFDSAYEKYWNELKEYIEEQRQLTGLLLRNHDYLLNLRK